MGNDTTIWALEAQTEAKHSLLKRYLGAWFPIMTQKNPKVLYFDGCAGPGVYENGEPGSPLIALQRLIEHRHMPSMTDCEVLFLFNEADPDRHASLDQEIKRYMDANSPWPANVKLYSECGEFESTAGDLVGRIEAAGQRLAPTFAFVDPFGFKGIPMDLLSRLVRSPQCELFVFFAFDSLNRWIGHPNEAIQAHLAALFGCNDYKAADPLRGEPRKKLLTDLYERQLRDEAKLPHVQGFEMVTDRGKSYFLFHGTRHVQGVKAMKEAMWNLDPTGSYRFSARTSNLPILPGMIPDTKAEQRQVADFFSGQTVSSVEVERYVLTDTRLAASHVKKLILRPLQERGEISCSNQTRRFTYPDRVMITFP
ncbi:three-Cys-motif partner protein TcmP [Rhodococcus hoagii]|nr:three-Cys-motif partner protein TcmP [Prescottella equi]